MPQQPGRSAGPGGVWPGLRLGIGLLTVLPVGAASTSRADARVAMLWAPAIGAALGCVAGAAAWGLAAAGAAPLVAGLAAVGLLAALTRGLHLDGLADTADGLGSGRDPARALAVMKASDIGPFGVVTLILALALQATAVAAALASGDDGRAVVVLALACAVGRSTLPWACRRGVPPARAEGLGALVAGAVPVVAAIGWTIVLLWLAAVAGLAADLGAARAVTAVALALLAAAALLRRCRQRIGGVTGDVLGALVETATTVALVVLSTA